MTVQKDQKKDAKSQVFDHDVIRDLAGLLEETNLAEIEIEHEGLRVRVARQLSIASGGPVAGVMAAAQPPLSSPGTDSTTKPEMAALHGGAVTSPMVGTAYLSPKPGDDPFVKVGDHVTKGQTLMIIEAMKTMNPIPATKPGIVSKVLVPDAHPVEYGEPLLIIE